MKPLRRKLRLGAIVDSAHIPLWAYHVLEQIGLADYARLEVMVQTGKRPTAKGWSARLKNALYERFLALDRLLYRPQADAIAVRDLRQVLPDVPIVQLNLTADGQEVLDRLRAYDLDLLIHLGLGKLSGDLMACTRYGAWSYQDGEVAGFWEVFRRTAATRVTLYHLTRAAERPQPISQTYAATDPHSVSRNRDRVCWKMAFILLHALKRFHDFGEAGLGLRIDEGAFLTVERAALVPNAWQLIILLVRAAYRRFYKKLWKWFNYEQWVLLYSLDEKERLRPAVDKYCKIIPPSQVYWADPQVVERDGRYYVFIEELPYASRKGRIACLTLDWDGNPSRPQTVLERPYHLSYPFIFPYRGTFYMIPESGQNRSIDLYRCRRFPDQWEFIKAIMQDVYAVDTTVFQMGGRWWLFTNINRVPADPAFGWDELSLFHAPDLFSDTWQPHPMNPVVSDVRSARPAGRVFEYRGIRYRPSQDCSRRYGYGIRLNRILKLDERNYEEVCVHSIEPTWDRKMVAAHTYNFAGRLTILDAELERSRIFRET